MSDQLERGTRVKHDVDVSVIIPFSDDEERVGRLARRVARHLRSLHLSFELLYADEGSGDNSVALLGLLARIELPEILLCTAPPGRGFAAAAAHARGQTLWLLDVARVDTPFSPFAWAHGRLVDDVADVVVVSGRFALARRTRAWKALDGVRGRGDDFERSLRRRARRHRLRVEGAMGDFAAHLVRRPTGPVPIVQPKSPPRAALWARVRALYTPSR